LKKQENRYIVLLIMSLKNKVLNYLETRGDEFVSGQQLADYFTVSRTAIWKAISELRKEGALINAVTNKGYYLVRESQKLSLDGLKKELPDFDIHYFDEIDSTNSYCKQISHEDRTKKTLVVSSKQTSGRGRRGRTFVSPNGGIYFSLLIDSHNNNDDNLLITSIAAVAITRAIKRVCDIDCKIKWVNDIFIGNRKVCGILSEGVIDMEVGKIRSMVVGIGINFSTPIEDFPEEVRDIVTSIYKNENSIPNNVSRILLVKEIVTEIYKIWDQLPSKDFLDEYRERSNVIGEKVTIYNKDNSVESGLAIDINDKAHLIVRLEDNSEIELGTGEVTLRVTK
jgi:BirA family biotin operon repressor/biotin-[acetyl-CoA-carboxylase] ligase